jgi:hypothetical protein
MNLNKNINMRKRRFLNVPVQNKTLILVFLAAIVPMSIVAVCLYYLIFNMLAWQLGIPEAIAYNLIPVAKRVSAILLMSLPVVLIIIWFAALELSHRIAGPVYKIEKELDDIIEGKKKGLIQLREKDEFKGLADKINKLISG